MPPTPRPTATPAARSGSSTTPAAPVARNADTTIPDFTILPPLPKGRKPSAWSELVAAHKAYNEDASDANLAALAEARNDWDKYEKQRRKDRAPKRKRHDDNEGGEEEAEGEGEGHGDEDDSEYEDRVLRRRARNPPGRDTTVLFRTLTEDEKSELELLKTGGAIPAGPGAANSLSVLASFAQLGVMSERLNAQKAANATSRADLRLRLLDMRLKVETADDNMKQSFLAAADTIWRQLEED